MIVLASASPTRARLLDSAGVTFAIAPVEIDEAELKGDLIRQGLSAKAVAQALADAKAGAVSRGQDEIIIGADQTLEFEGVLLSKACDAREAREILQKLRGKSHQLHSAVALAREGQVVWRCVSSPRLKMRHFSDEFLERYLSRCGADAASSLGGYHLEGPGAQLLERVTGDYFAVLGLPLIPLLAVLRREGALPR